MIPHSSLPRHSGLKPLAVNSCAHLATAEVGMVAAVTEPNRRTLCVYVLTGKVQSEVWV